MCVAGKHHATLWHGGRPMNDATAYTAILFDIDDGVATVTLNWPERMNAWTDTMAAALADVMKRCDLDDAVRAVVVTGAGRARTMARSPTSTQGPRPTLRDQTSA